MICKKCGREVANSAKFCDGCGASMISSDYQDLQMAGHNTIVKNEAQENKVIFILAYFGILFFLPLVACSNSKIGRFHANQGLVLLVTGIVGQIVFGILSTILWRLWFLTTIISSAWGLALLALMIIGMLNAYNGEQKPLPIIGELKILKEL
jgi:uncharacterized membrane protein